MPLNDHRYRSVDRSTLATAKQSNTRSLRLLPVLMNHLVQNNSSPPSMLLPICWGREREECVTTELQVKGHCTTQNLLFCKSLICYALFFIITIDIMIKILFSYFPLSNVNPSPLQGSTILCIIHVHKNSLEL